MGNLEQYEDYYSTLLYRIAAEREIRGISKKEMAEKLGMHQVSYGQKEAGKQKFSFTELLAVSEILHMDIMPKTEGLTVINEDVIASLIRSQASMEKTLGEILKRLPEKDSDD